MIEGAIIGSIHKIEDSHQEILFDPNLVKDFTQACTNEQISYLRQCNMKHILMCMSFYYLGFGSGEKTIIKKIIG